MLETAIWWSFVCGVLWANTNKQPYTHAFVSVSVSVLYIYGRSFPFICALSTQIRKSECINLSICQNGIGLSLSLFRLFPPLSPNTFLPVLAYKHFPFLPRWLACVFFFFSSCIFFLFHTFACLLYIFLQFWNAFLSLRVAVCCCYSFFSFHFICLIFLLDNIVVTVLYCYIAVAILSFRLLCTIVSIVIGCVCAFFHYILFGICSIKLCAWCGLCFSHSPTHSFPLRLYLVQPGYAHTACINILSLTVYFS